MKLWVDVLRFIKRGATGGALGFFTYMELSKSSFNAWAFSFTYADFPPSDLATRIPSLQA